MVLVQHHHDVCVNDAAGHSLVAVAFDQRADLELVRRITIKINGVRKWRLDE